MTTRASFVIAILVLVGCMKTSSKFCEMHEADPRCVRSDAPIATCTSEAECSEPTPVCNLDTSTCVECIVDEQCGQAAPICGDDDRCRGCAAHSECASAACLPDGTCAPEDQVAYVLGGASGSGMCTRAEPCGTLVDALGTPRDVIKMSGLVENDLTSAVEGRQLTILADPGTRLDRTTSGSILELRGAGTQVSIYDLEITGGIGANDPAVLVTAGGGVPQLTLTRAKVTKSQGRGISCTGCALTITRSTIAENDGGGIRVEGVGATFDITNTYVYRNGNVATGTFGGLDLAVLTAATSRLEFNTIVDNRANVNGAAGGVVCNLASFTAANNLIARNELGADRNAPTSQTSGACTYPTSRIQSDLLGLALAGTEAAPYSYKLTGGSDAIDQALTASSVAIDHDGDSRPQGSEPDIGADEFMP